MLLARQQHQRASVFSAARSSRAAASALTTTTRAQSAKSSPRLQIDSSLALSKLRLAVAIWLLRAWLPWRQSLRSHLVDAGHLCPSLRHCLLAKARVRVHTGNARPSASSSSSCPPPFAASAIRSRAAIGASGGNPTSRGCAWYGGGGVMYVPLCIRG
jgi:hypothetical protein